MQPLDFDYSYYDDEIEVELVECDNEAGGLHKELEGNRKKIFDDIVDYNDQLIVCENCEAPIIIRDILTPMPTYCKTCLKYWQC